jgi:hypothetical protein
MRPEYAVVLDKKDLGRKSVCFDVTNISLQALLRIAAQELNGGHYLLHQKQGIPSSLQSGGVYLLNSLLFRKRGFDCGFNTYSALKPTPSNKEKHELFLREVLHTCKVGDKGERSDSVVRELNGAYIEFIIGEHPTIPHNCDHFLRFSFKVSGSLTAATNPYIEGTCKITKK